MAEFVQSPHNERSVVLLAVHAVQFDTHSSRSRPGALGERWADMIGRGAFHGLEEGSSASHWPGRNRAGRGNRQAAVPLCSVL